MAAADGQLHHRISEEIHHKSYFKGKPDFTYPVFPKTTSRELRTEAQLQSDQTKSGTSIDPRILRPIYRQREG